MEFTLANSDYLNSLKVFLPQSKAVGLVLIGCGGTGSWLAPSVVRIARLLKEKFSNEVHVIFLDPDVVEGKNIYRQNFCDAEIGRNKAEALAFRYGLAWGVDITAVSEKFQGIPWSNGTTIMIGCVDSTASRAAINRYRVYSRNVWWLDCGNMHSYGQVILGSMNDRPEDVLFPEGCINWLPSPANRHPELVEQQKEKHTEPQKDLSCAEIAMIDEQGLFINQAIANIAANYLGRLLLTKDLRTVESYIDLASGTMNSVYITKELVEKNG